MNNDHDQENPAPPQQRPPNRPSTGVRYGYMRSALQQAALMRATRKQDLQSTAPSVNNVSTQWMTTVEHATDQSSSSGDTAIEFGSEHNSNRQGMMQQQNNNSNAQPENQNDRYDPFENPRSFEEANNDGFPEYNPADFEQQQPEYDHQQQHQPNEHMPTAEQMQERRQARNEQSGQTWKSCMAEPSGQWSQRKCNLYLHIGAVLVCMFSEHPKCNIPLGMWLAGQFAFLIVETMFIELKDRMNSSTYWDENRGHKKCILRSLSATKELSELAWQIYGFTLYFSSQSDGCSEENGGYMFVMLMFLIMAILKFVLLIVIVGVLIFVCSKQRLQRRNERSASKDILRSLGRIKYSALSIGQNETDEECSICFVEYTEDDIVTKLECNEKHVFHEDCIGNWISQGKNSCPICRAPINSQIEL